MRHGHKISSNRFDGQNIAVATMAAYSARGALSLMIWYVAPVPCARIVSQQRIAWGTQ